MSTDVSAPFPDLELPPGATITVELDDASAVVTKLNVYGISPTGERVELEVQAIPPLFAYGPDAV